MVTVDFQPLAKAKVTFIFPLPSEWQYAAVQAPVAVVYFPA